MRPHVNPKFRVAGLAVVIVSCVVLSGCGSDPKAPDTTAPDGFTVVKNDKAGIAVAIPADWQKVPLTDDLDDFNRTANRLRGENPKLSAALVQARVVAQAGGKLFAVDREGVASVNMTVDEADEKTLDEIMTTAKPALTNAGATEISDEGVDLPAGPAKRLRFKLPVGSGADQVVVDEVQYYLLKDGKAYILTVAAGDPALALTIAETLRIR